MAETGMIPGWAKLLMWFKRPGETVQEIKKASEGLTDEAKRQMVSWAVAEGVIPTPGA